MWFEPVLNVSVLYISFVFSPNKTEFIKAKYQMLAYVHRMPCREDDSVTAKDLSKVSSFLNEYIYSLKKISGFKFDIEPLCKN